MLTRQAEPMLLSAPDILALAYFVGAWIAYSIVMWRRQFMSQSRLAFSKTLPR
jgi:xanthosine utilization system XapX-like protein